MTDTTRGERRDAGRGTAPRQHEQSLQQISAHRWKGERGCVVGPFNELSQAQLFEHYVLHRNGVSTPYGAVHARGTSWFITVPA
jgi:hypothetical protein